MEELGLLKNYGNIIFSISMILYGLLYTFLEKDYNET